MVLRRHCHCHQRHCHHHCHRDRHHLGNLIFTILVTMFIIIITFTRSYAALPAADLDWIVGPGYSPGG